MNIAIVDTSSTNRTRLYNDIKKLSIKSNLLTYLTKFENEESFYANTPLFAIEVVFLAIHLESISTTKISLKIHELKPSCQIVFVLTSPSITIDIQPTNYCILTPYSENALILLLSKLDRHCIKSSRFIQVKEEHKLNNLLLCDILYTEYSQHRIQIHTETGIVSANIKFPKFLKMLSLFKEFLLCYRYIIINMDKIRKVDNQFFLLSNGEYIPISPKYANQIQSHYSDYIFNVIEEDSENDN